MSFKYEEQQQVQTQKAKAAKDLKSDKDAVKPEQGIASALDHCVLQLMHTNPYKNYRFLVYIKLESDRRVKHEAVVVTQFKKTYWFLDNKSTKRFDDEEKMLWNFQDADWVEQQHNDVSGVPYDIEKQVWEQKIHVEDELKDNVNHKLEDEQHNNIDGELMEAKHMLKDIG
jgi:hypothetical protein